MTVPNLTRVIRAGSTCVLTVTIVASALDCAGSPTRSSDLGVSLAIVYGTVTGQGGDPVAGATIRGIVFHQPCASGAVSGGGQPDIVETDSAGRYRQRLAAAVVSQFCIVVSAKPPAGVGLDSTSVSGTLLQFKESHDVPYDSARVDVVLPASR